MTPKLNERVIDATREAIKRLKAWPAVNRVLTTRLTGKWTHYAQVLLAYSPTKFSIADVNLVTLPDVLAKSSHD